MNQIILRSLVRFRQIRAQELHSRASIAQLVERTLRKEKCIFVSA